MFIDKNKLLVLGFGNEILTDDGIAVKLVNDMKNKSEDPKIVYHTSWLGGLEILEYFKEEYRSVLFIDATKTGEVKPGTIKQYDMDNFEETLHLSNFHDASFINAIKLAHKLGYKVPQSINVLSIEIVEDELFGKSFSKEIEAQYKSILSSVSGIITSLSKSE